MQVVELSRAAAAGRAHSAFGTVHTATDGRDILTNSPDGWEVDQPWLWWDGPADGDGTGGPFGNPPPGAEFAGPTLRGTAVPAVTACVQELADPIAGMPWKFYRGRERLETPSWITDPQALRPDGRRLTAPGPDARLSAVEFWSQYITSMLNLGEGIAYTPRQLDDDGEPTGPIIAPIYNLNPLYVETDEDGRYYVDDDLEEDGRSYIDPRELIVTRNIVRSGRVRGLGVLQAHAADLGLAGYIRTYADNLYQRGIPNGYLKSSKPDLDKTQADKLKEQWLKQHGGPRKSIGVLNATTEFHPLTMDPQAVALIDLFRLAAWQICLMYGVPPARLGINMGGSLTYTNLQMDNAAFYTRAPMRIARRLESAFDATLPAGQQLKIDFRQLLRGDAKTRMEEYAIGLKAHIYTVDEVRDWEDLEPIGTTTTPAQE